MSMKSVDAKAVWVVTNRWPASLVNWTTSSCVSRLKPTAYVNRNIGSRNKAITRANSRTTFPRVFWCLIVSLLGAPGRQRRHAGYGVGGVHRDIRRPRLRYVGREQRIQRIVGDGNHHHVAARVQRAGRQGEAGRGGLVIGYRYQGPVRSAPQYSAAKRERGPRSGTRRPLDVHLHAVRQRRRG